MRAHSGTRIRAAFAVALAVVGATAGCRTVPEAAPETAPVAAVQPASNPQAAPGSDAAGAITEYATGAAPQAWPADLPLYSPASIQSSRVTAADDLLDMRVSLSADGDLATIIGWHEAMATRHGWRIESSGSVIRDGVEWNYLYLTKAGSSANVSIAEDPNGQVAITVAARSW